MNHKVHLDEVAGLLSKRPFEPHPLLREGHAQTIAGWAWPGVSGATLSAHAQEKRSACSK